MYVSLMWVYRCRQFVDINCRLQLYKLEAKKKSKSKSNQIESHPYQTKLISGVILCTPHIPRS